MWVLCLVDRVQNRGELESRGVFSDGEARSFGTTALCNCERRVVAVVEVGGDFLGVSKQAVARGLRTKSRTCTENLSD